MSKVILITLGGISGIFVLKEFLMIHYYKKHGKDKEAISKELVDLLRK